MSASDSNLSSPKYGYDFVVALTQESINANMKEYISGLQSPEVVKTYIMDVNGNPQEVDYQTLLKSTNGTDPFSIANDADVSSQEIKNLTDAYFYYGFKAKLGLPPGYAPEDIPDVVAFGQDSTSTIFNLMCSEFQIVAANYGPRGIASWLNVSQAPGDAWMFTSKVNLSLIGDNTKDNLPPAVQKALDNIGSDAFSLQQLLFDLDNAALESVPSISGVKSGSAVYTALQEAFLGAYFDNLKSNGQPVLGYTVKMNNVNNAPASSLKLTDLNIDVSPYTVSGNADPTNGQADTLCYLCAIDGNKLPPQVPFTWNWVDTDQLSDLDGVISVNKNTFLDFIKGSILDYAQTNCLSAYVKATVTDAVSVDYTWSLTPNQNPTVTYPDSGTTVMTVAYDSKSFDQAGLDGFLGHLNLNSAFCLSVDFSGNSFVITQHLKIYIDIDDHSDETSANVVDKTITDTYELIVDDTANLTLKLSSSVQDNSQKLNPPSSFLSDALQFNGQSISMLTSKFTEYAQKVASQNFTDIPVSSIGNFVFPGGNTFDFKDAGFSNNQDLYVQITYVDPN